MFKLNYEKTSVTPEGGDRKNGALYHIVWFADVQINYKISLTEENYPLVLCDYLGENISAYQELKSAAFKETVLAPLLCETLRSYNRVYAQGIFYWIDALIAIIWFFSKISKADLLNKEFKVIPY